MTARVFENPKSRFRQAMGEGDLDLVNFGTATVFGGENRDLNGMMYQAEHLKNVFLIVNHNNVIDGLIIRRMLNIRQARQFFGKNAGATVKENEDQDSRSAKIEFVHFILPREEKNVGPLATQLPIASVWIEVSKKEQIQESGFFEFPYAVPRFDTTTGEEWGRGPGMIALPDSNMLQAMDETIIVGAQKAIEPPIMAPDDGSFNAANTVPGGISYYDAELAKEMGRIPVAPLDTGARIELGLEMQQDRRFQVEKAFFKHVLNLPVDGPEMTATEVIKRDQEFMREMGGLFGRLESDYIAPVVERAFNVMLRAGAFPEIPEILQGQNVRFEFESPLKKVRQQIEAAAARNWKADIIELSTIRPEAVDVINVDQYARFQAEANSVPLDNMNDTETIAAIRQQRAEAEAAQQKMVEMVEGAGGIEKFTKALKNASDAEGGNETAA